jgi:hypothetical protein
MRYQDVDENGIHKTQVRVTASLVRQGMAIPDIVALVLAATRVAAGDYGANWNWVAEERSLVKMCESALRKFGVIQSVSEEKIEPVALNEGQLGEEQKAFVQGNIVDLQQAKAKLQTGLKVVAQQAKSKKFKIVSETLKTSLGQTLVFDQNGQPWDYYDGLWALIDDFKDWLGPKTQDVCNSLNIVCDNKLASEVKGDIERDSDLRPVIGIPWDSHGCIPTKSGLIDPRTGLFEPIGSSHFCTWRVACDYEPDAKCPVWLQMLSDMFADRDLATKDQIIETLQELLGAGLIDRKGRGLRRALVLHGGVNSGKSNVLEVFSALFGGCIAPEIDTIDDTHGMMPFRARLPWILDEAFSREKWNPPSNVKKLITCEPVNINPKNKDIISHRFLGPIFWATNNPPQFKENTRAMVERMIIIDCHAKFSFEEPTGAAVVARSAHYDSPASYVVDKELPGVLNWALGGLRRALERGFIATGIEQTEAAEAVFEESNFLSAFIKDWVDYDPHSRMANTDFCFAAAVWYGDNLQEDRRSPNNVWILRNLTALHDDRIERDRDERKKWILGVKLNGDGLKLFGRALESKAYEGKKVSCSTDPKEVNQRIPSSWDKRPKVIKMRIAQARGKFPGDTKMHSCDGEGIPIEDTF